MNLGLKKTILFSLLSLAAANSHGHGAWVAKRAGEPTVIYGHGAIDDSYKPSKVASVKGFDKDNKAVEIGKIEHEKNVTLEVPRNAAYLGLIFDNGYWTKNTEGKWKNVPKNEVPNAESAGRYVKNAIVVLSKSATVKAVEGLNVQIIPAQNPLKMKAGDSLDVTVLLDGKPLADAEIISDYVNQSHVKDVKTNAEGKAIVVIRNQGLNVIGLDYTEKLTGNPKADENGYLATLSFELGHLDHE